MSKNIGTLQNKNGDILYPSVVDTITNDNGTAVKFADGTMICYGRYVLSTSITISWGTGLFVTERENGINYPSSFLDLPSVSMMPIAPSSTWLMTGDFGSFSQTPSYWLVCGTSIPEPIRFNISYIAIGHWK